MKQLTDEQIETLEALCVDPVDTKGWGFLNRKSFARAVIAEFCKINGLTGEAQPAEQAKGQTVEFLANATRFKVVQDSRNGCKIYGLPVELSGRWVALVAAEDDCHLNLTTPPAQPAREWVGLSGGDFLKLHDEFGIIPDTARVIEKLLREKNAGQPIIHKDEDLLRERFHAWARAQGFDDRVLVKPRTTYTGSHLQMLWEAWLACASTTRNQHEQENDHTEGGSPPA